MANLDLASGILGGGLMAFAAAFLLVFVVIMIVLYIYMSLAFMAIGKKAKLKTPALAWIPAVGPGIIAYQASKMHWWPWLLLIGIIIPVVGGLAQLAFFVFFIIWMWKTFEVINKPNWWAILLIIPVVNLVIIGIAAWSK